jgi:starch phosphorylase
MTVAAIRLAGQVNGVSARHGEETRGIWKELWPGRERDQVPIRHVTNGVHLGTWMCHPVHELLDQYLGRDWPSRMDESAVWEQVFSIDDAALWTVHNRVKRSLLGYLREDARRRWGHEWRDVAQLSSAGTLLATGALTIGFARRFTAYKRPDLIFHDADRLRALLVNPWRPVQLIFAGKAHPADEQGKRLLQQVYSFTRDPAFEGRIAFLEDYELHLAHRLVQGVDLWLNLPRPPLEASGTSGMKAALNAVPQLGTHDGWWVEGYNGMNGWLIPEAPANVDADAADAEHLYRLLEQEIVPLFYDLDDLRVPLGWVQRMKHALAQAGQHFTARRMLQDYVCNHYLPVLTGAAIPDDPPKAGYSP